MSLDCAPCKIPTRSKRILAEDGGVVEWIPFTQFTEVEKIGEGGFGQVYKAKWTNGPIAYSGWSTDINDWNRRAAALKSVLTTDGLINEAELTHESEIQGYRLYGITQGHSSGRYSLVLTFAEMGDVRHYIRNKFKDLIWYNRIELLHGYYHDLYQIHKRGIIHADIHSGNILLDSSTLGMICDMGAAKPRPARTSSGRIRRYGVTAYVAPVVLRGRGHTRESDVHALGICMWEMCAGRPPFGKRPFDVHLALDIFDGIRPELVEGVPDFYQELVERCWNPEPPQRPSAEVVSEIASQWYDSPSPEIEERIRIAEGYRRQAASKCEPEESYQANPLTIYTAWFC